MTATAGGSEPRACLVYVTAPDEETAIGLARLLLNRRLCGCVNVVPGLRSLYWWEGKLADEAEALLTVKTLPSLVDEVVRAVREAHPYSVPAILVLPVVGGDAEYIRWLAGECATRRG